MKKVLFVCGSLEPGHDGVGDYTRELAGALQKIGLDAKIIAIRDRNIQNVVEEKQPAREQSVDVVRLGMSMSFIKRRREYQRLLTSFRPDWISLQYVPYAFSSKGIPFGLSRFLDTGEPMIKWHFMIHESFIDGNLNFKDQLIKKSQIAVIKSLEKNFKPVVVNTSTPQYQSYLSAIGVKSKILGLFGNIPISKAHKKGNNNHSFRGVYFGAAPDFENISAFVKPLSQYMKESEGNLEIILCGKSGEKGKQFAALLRSSINSERFFVIEKGRMSTEELSKLFLEVDFGIARISPQLIGKSGSAIALLEHGLPLWVPLAESKDALNSFVDFRTNQCFNELMEVKNNNCKFEIVSRLEEISMELKNQLLSSENLLEKA